MTSGGRHPDPRAMARMKQAFDRVIAQGRDIEAELGPRRPGVPEVVALAEAARNDDELCAVAILFIEPLLDETGAEVIDDMESAMRSSAPLRRAYSCADHELPDDLRLRLAGLLTAEDQIP